MSTPRELVAQMTLEEKASLLSGADFWHTRSVDRLGIRAVMVSDGPHGLRKQDEAADHLGVNESIKAVCFPAACATTASFDRALVNRLGQSIGDQCQHEEVAVNLGPAINIKRSPSADATLNTCPRIPTSWRRWPPASSRARRARTSASA